MVLPITDEANPKCFLCHEGFSNMDELRRHQEKDHAEHAAFSEKTKPAPAPGDVSLF